MRVLSSRASSRLILFRSIRRARFSLALRCLFHDAPVLVLLLAMALARSLLYQAFSHALRSLSRVGRGLVLSSGLTSRPCLTRSAAFSPVLWYLFLVVPMLVLVSGTVMPELNQ